MKRLLLFLGVTLMLLAVSDAVSRVTVDLPGGMECLVTVDQDFSAIEATQIQPQTHYLVENIPVLVEESIDDISIEILAVYPYNNKFTDVPHSIQGYENNKRVTNKYIKPTLQKGYWLLC